MLRKLNILVLLITLTFLYSCKDEVVNPAPKIYPIELNDTEKSIVDELDKFITPLKGTTPSLDNSDLLVFDQFAYATVIGLGEDTHGTKEFFQMKHRLFKYFVEKHGFKIFGFEADMGECIYIDRFITKGVGTIADAMNKMHFWTWKTEEVKDLILWMKDHNSGKSEQDKIHLLGVDCQFTDYNKALIEEYLNNYDNNYPAYINTILTEISSLTYEDGSSIDAAKKDTLKKRCDSIYTYFADNNNRLIAKSGKFEYDIITRLIEQSKQFLDGITETTYNFRDYYMAQNTIWLTTLLGNQTKVISWAHNAHVDKDPDLLDGTQGYFLSQELGMSYKVIGFSFNQGSFRAVNYDSKTNQYSLIQHTINQLPIRESTNYIFQAAIPKDFILMFSNIPVSNPLYTWLNTSRKFMLIGARYSIDEYSNYYLNFNLKNAFDAIIHIQKTNSAIEFK